jgi:hypothetical protein
MYALSQLKPMAEGHTCGYMHVCLHMDIRPYLVFSLQHALGHQQNKHRMSKCGHSWAYSIVYLSYTHTYSIVYFSYTHTHTHTHTHIHIRCWNLALLSDINVEAVHCAPTPLISHMNSNCHGHGHGHGNGYRILFSSHKTPKHEVGCHVLN